MAPLIKGLFPKDLDFEKDLFLGETSVQIKGLDFYPSVHLVKSYQSSKNDEQFYHIFEYKTGLTVVNYNPEQYKQVSKFIDLSDHWSIFYKDEKGLLPVSKVWRKDKTRT